MRFTIITTKNGHQPPQSRCDFLPPGGTIGRGIDNNLVLPDDERTISRLQAIVHITAEGDCRITNRGNVTRVMLNDIPLERGRQVDLQDGDIIGIDDYRLQVNDLQVDGAAAAPDRPEIPPPTPALNTASAPVPGEIWDDLVQEFSTAGNFSSPTAAQPQGAVNPFTEPVNAERNPVDPLSLLADQSPSLMPEQRQRLPEELFSDDKLFQTDSLFADHTPSTLLQHPAGAVVSRPLSTSQDEQDPLALFGADHSTAQLSQDPLGLMMAEPVLSGDAADSPKSPPLTTAPSAAMQPQSDQQYDGITLPTPQAVARTHTPPPKGRLRIDPVADNVAHQSSVPDSNEALQGELLQALINGMGLNDMQPTPRFEPHNMEQLGQMLSMFSQGTVALLSSRSILKRGVKAEMTVILDEANNPFKLLPSGKTVLMQMFGSRMPGFMPPTQSVRDALVDLQAHQLGMIAGIRAIIASMLQSFNPEQLEQEARNDGVTSRLSFPRSRKATLWEQYSKRYQQIAGEIEDDFHTLFGEAFLHAYDMEVNQFKDSQNRLDK
ncbi:type VI secretion system-associated FHA domain protein TagH [Winslowiella iniecta]|uniref:Signal peptide protein n=1 Tax=Winslowiella iniecta TaxID=1560201 RepID=A0A0L7T2Y4_9GAMM|nr:type VI secretion system-associated FHA domain protein TagH [Winslowiella iniecta]KOC88087.1 signal peptide protein [Winslowiella iniecta]KOC89670.1 signal peptide protein [Winslowiella iniecta]